MFNSEEINESNQCQNLHKEKKEYLKALLSRYQEVIYELEHLNAEKEELSNLMLENMAAKYEFVDDYVLCKYERINIKVTLEEAREFGATTMKEEVDKKKLHELLNCGEKIAYEKKEYLKITQKENKEEV